LAVGFGIIWRSHNIFHVVYGSLYVVCAYAFYVFMTVMQLNFTNAFFLTITFAALLGWIIEIFFYRPFYQKKASASSVLIASLGLFFVLENLVAMIFGNEIQSISRDLSKTYEVGCIILTEIQLLEFFLGAISLTLLWGSVKKIHYIKAIWAMGDQPELISVIGISPFVLRNLALIISTIMASIPACLITYDIGIDPYEGMSYLLISAVAVLFGGTHRYVGWIIGSIVLSILQSIVIWQFSARWMDMVTFSLLVLILMFRPHGIMDFEKRLEEDI